MFGLKKKKKLQKSILSRLTELCIRYRPPKCIRPELREQYIAPNLKQSSLRIIKLNTQDSIDLAAYIYKNIEVEKSWQKEIKLFDYPFYKYHEVMDYEDFIEMKEYEKWNIFRRIPIEWFCGGKTRIELQNRSEQLNSTRDTQQKDTDDQPT